MKINVLTIALSISGFSFNALAMEAACSEKLSSKHKIVILEGEDEDSVEKEVAEVLKNERLKMNWPRVWTRQHQRLLTP